MSAAQVQISDQLNVCDVEEQLYLVGNPGSRLIFISCWCELKRAASSTSPPQTDPDHVREHAAAPLVRPSSQSNH